MSFNNIAYRYLFLTFRRSHTVEGSNCRLSLVSIFLTILKRRSGSTCEICANLDKALKRDQARADSRCCSKFKASRGKYLTIARNLNTVVQNNNWV